MKKTLKWFGIISPKLASYINEEFWISIEWDQLEWWDGVRACDGKIQR
jgi:hypothetical protein